MPNLGTLLNFVRVSNAVAAGVTTVTGTHVNMSGFDGVLFLFAIGTLIAGQATSFKAQGGNQSNDSDEADMAGTSGGIVSLADGDSNKVFALDVYRPIFQYVRPVVLRATQNAVVDGIFALQYQGMKLGYGSNALSPALDATVKALAILASPAYGTA